MITWAISQLSAYLVNAFSVPDSSLATGVRTDFLSSFNSFVQETDMQTSNYITRKQLPSKQQ